MFSVLPTLRDVIVCIDMFYVYILLAYDDFQPQSSAETVKFKRYLAASTDLKIHSRIFKRGSKTQFFSVILQLCSDLIYLLKSMSYEPQMEASIHFPDEI